MHIIRYTCSLILTLCLICHLGAQNGNIGIGIDTPSQKLHIQDGNLKIVNPARPWVIFDHPPSTLGGGLQWWLDGDVEMEFFYDAIHEDLRFWDTPSGVPRLVLKRTGNVGLGVTNPSSALEINGKLELGEYPYSTIRARGDTAQLRLWSSFTPFRGAYILANSAKFGADAGSMYFTHGDYTDTGPESLIYFRYASDSIITNQMVLTSGGNLGIGTTNPMARLHVQDSSVLFSGLYNGTDPGPPPATGVGVRMMWYPDKAAFRAGRLGVAQATYWDKDSIGHYSFAVGYDTRASGAASVAMGRRTSASASYSTALGEFTTASGNNATAMGDFTVASGRTAFAMGMNSIASGDESLAGGNNCEAQGQYSTALGLRTVAGSAGSFVIGKFNVGGGTAGGWVWYDPVFEIGIGASEADRANAMTIFKNAGALWEGMFDDTAPDPPPIEGEGTRMMWYPEKAAFRAGLVDSTQWDQDNIGFVSFASGANTKAVGNVSTALGFHTDAQAYASLAIGRYNMGLGNAVSWNSSDPLFEIGVGTSSSDRANAMTVLKNGMVGIDTDNPLVKLHITGGTDAGLASGGYLQNGLSSGVNLLLDDNEIMARFNGSGTTLYLNNDGGNIVLAGGSTGNVGIRTSSPQEALHVEGTIEVDHRIQANDSDGLELASDEGTVRLKVADNGRIGIGTTSPSSILDIRAYDPTVIIDNTATTGNYTIEFQENSVFRGSIGYNLTNDYLFIYEDGTVMVQDGDLGVGVTSIPAGRRIHVSGGAYCTGTTWTNASSRSLKENFQPVDRQEILDKLARMPVSQWNYLEEEMQGRHIGPMSEDFFDAFGLGGDPRAISTVDIAGVTVASIQALYQRQQTLEQENRELRLLISNLEKRLEQLEVSRN